MVKKKYSGYKLLIPFEFNSIQDKIQIDLGYGEIIWPDVQEIIINSVLPDYKSFSLLGYPLESVVSEKLHAIINEGERNTRMKDFYDLYIVLENCSFNQKILSEAIIRTFQNRETEIKSLELNSILYSSSFPELFKNFCRKSKIPLISFNLITVRLRNAFYPIFLYFEDNQIPDEKTIWNLEKLEWD